MSRICSEPETPVPLRERGVCWLWVNRTAGRGRSAAGGATYPYEQTLRRPLIWPKSHSVDAADAGILVGPHWSRHGYGPWGENGANRTVEQSDGRVWWLSQCEIDSWKRRIE